MKKALLLATTAFVAAAFVAPAAQADATVTVGGYMNQYFGWGGNDDPIGTNTDPQDFQQFSAVEVHVDAEYATENGLTLGAHVELMGDNDEVDTRTVDEHFATIEGGFGRVEIGATSSAPYKMHVIAPAVGMPINNGEVDQILVGFNGGSGAPGVIPTVLDRTVLGGTFLEIGGSDADQKISYFTPSYNGFMAGVTYQPDITTENVIGDNDDTYNNGFAGGLGYYGTFNDVMIEASAGYFFASSPNAADDYNAYNLGLSLGTAMGDGDVTIGGSFAQVLDNDAIQGEGYSFDIGASYDTGPWAASLTYMMGDTDTGAALLSDGQTDTVAAGVRYALAEGANLTATLGWANIDTGSTDINDGVFATAGILLDF